MPDTQHSLKALADWYQQTSLGMQLADQIKQQLDTIVPSLFGYHLLLAGLYQPHWLDKSFIRHQIIMTDWPAEQTSLLGECENLPFMAECLDVIVLPHSLELSDQPEDLLQNIDHSLVPGGHLIIIGFNPYSLWGWRRALSDKQCAPWRGKFYSSMKTRRLLRRLGYEVTMQQNCFYRPPLNNEKLLHKLLFLESLGKLLMPCVAGAYVLVAKKKVASLMPIRPVWRLKDLIFGKAYADRPVGAKRSDL